MRRVMRGSRVSDERYAPLLVCETYVIAVVVTVYMLMIMTLRGVRAQEPQVVDDVCPGWQAHVPPAILLGRPSLRFYSPRYDFKQQFQKQHCGAQYQGA
jgi:hypothetical protein